MNGLKQERKRVSL